MRRKKFGRENLFDWPSKLAIIVQKSRDQGTLTYLSEHLYAHMLRKAAKDPFGLEDLKARSGICVHIFLATPLHSTNATGVPEPAAPAIA